MQIIWKINEKNESTKFSIYLTTKIAYYYVRNSRI